MFKLIRIWICLVAGLFCISVHGQEQSKIKLSAVTPELRAAAEKALEGIRASTTETSKGINKNGVYAITGNIFGDGRSRAVLDIKGTVVLCSWTRDPVGTIGIF